MFVSSKNCAVGADITSDVGATVPPAEVETATLWAVTPEPGRVPRGVAVTVVDPAVDVPEILNVPVPSTVAVESSKLPESRVDVLTVATVVDALATVNESFAPI